MPQRNVARSKAPWGAIGSILIAVLYGVSPIDLIPDIIPLLGWTDDAAVVILMILIAIRLLRKKSLRKRELQPVSWRGKG